MAYTRSFIARRFGWIVAEIAERQSTASVRLTGRDSSAGLTLTS
jgi:hypothetical protein